MKLIKLFFILIAALFNSSLLAREIPRLHNHTSSILDFWSKHKEDILPVQIEVFKAEVVPTFPEYYQFKFNKWMRQGKNPDIELSKEIQEFPQIEEKFKERSLKIGNEIENNLKRFLETFKDFDTNLDIHILHSLGEMDGGVRKINGKVTFIFGVDSIAKYHDAESDTPFFHHELFHVYHMQFFKGGDALWESLWFEGLATLVSQKLNPKSSMRELMLDFPPELVSQCNANLTSLLEKLNSVLESTTEEDYETFFLLSSSDSNVPKRAGYYLGYLIAKEINKELSLEQMSKLSGTELLNRIKVKLIDSILSTSTTHSFDGAMRSPND